MIFSFVTVALFWLFRVIFEKQKEPCRRQVLHSIEESLLSSQSLSVGLVRTGRLVNEFGLLSSWSREKSCRDSENEQMKILPERQKEQILVDCRAGIHKHEFHADCERVSKNWMELSSLNEVRLIVFSKETTSMRSTTSSWKAIEA